MDNALLGAGLLGIVGLLGLGYVLWYVQAWAWPWRRILPLLPTPALAIASSYGVYAFNRMFVPVWVAVAMAAAYELVYIGFAAMTSISAEARAFGRRIAQAAAGISFLQNLIAALLHALPEVRAVIADLSMAWQIGVWALLAALHAVQVFVAYFSAEMTLHRAHADDAYAAQRTQPRYPPPVPMSVDNDADDDSAAVDNGADDDSTAVDNDVNSPTPDIKNATPDMEDPRAVTARRLRSETNPATGRPYTWQEIADVIGVNSRQAAQRLATKGTTHGGAK